MLIDCFGGSVDREKLDNAKIIGVRLQLQYIHAIAGIHEVVCYDIDKNELEERLKAICEPQLLSPSDVLHSTHPCSVRDRERQQESSETSSLHQFMIDVCHLCGKFILLLTLYLRLYM